jgi:DNA-binding LytR/AlgR family response regulator
VSQTGPGDAMQNDTSMNKRVLLLEDELVVSHEMKARIQNTYNAIEVDAFHSVEDALESEHLHSANLYLVDYDMGLKRNGIELVRKVREQNKTAPIYVITGQLSKLIQKERQDDLDFKVLSKPLSHILLMNVLEMHIAEAS